MLHHSHPSPLTPMGWRLVSLLPVLLASILLSSCDATPPPSDPASESSAASAQDTSLRHAIGPLHPTYVCPMHPQIVRDEPGTCPICGMTLVEQRPDLTTQAPSQGRPEVQLGGRIIQTLGVRTGHVTRGAVWEEIRAVGRVVYDETRLVHLHPRADGFVQGLAVRSEGAPVRQGQELAQLYAPAILSAQVDFLLALEPQPTGVSQVKADKARNILRLLDVPEAVIREIERRRETRQTVPVLAPIAGVVTQLTAREGMYVTAATEMFTIADLSRVWVLVDVFEHQIDWLSPGLAAEMRLPARPGRTWTGRVDYLYPALDPRSRTLRVRLVFDNPGMLLKPNMFADVIIEAAPRHEVLKAPAEAVIVTGERTSIIKALGDGRFQPVDVVTGLQAGREIELLSGLEEGDEIVVSGQFLIDSESALGNAGEHSSTGMGGEHAH